MCPKEKLARAPKRLGINRITSYLYHNVSKSVCVCVCSPFLFFFLSIYSPFYQRSVCVYSSFFFFLSIYSSLYQRSVWLCVCVCPFFLSVCLSIHPSSKWLCVCVSAFFSFCLSKNRKKYAFYIAKGILHLKKILNTFICYHIIVELCAWQNH